jgi:RIO kinase 2
MSSVQSVAKLVKILETEDYIVLKALSSAISRHKFLNIDQIAGCSKMHRDVVGYRIGRLSDFKLISKSTNGVYLLMSGLDVVALKIFVEKNIVDGLGMPIGVGKESDVVEAITENAQVRAIKFFRIGRISFRQVRKKRSFITEEQFHHWLLTNIRAAKKEYTILRKLHNQGVTIPTPYYRILHAIVMSRVEGTRLAEAKDIVNPRQILYDILRGVRVAYQHDIINCDLSEYNILIDIDSRPWIIDWPQSVSRRHPNAELLIRRDISNVVNFFNKRFHLGINSSEALEEVLTGFS